MKIGLLTLFLILVGCSSGNGASPSDWQGGKFTPLFSDASGVMRLVNTLTTESPVFSSVYNKDTVGFVYTPVCSGFSGVPLPLSYWTSVDYFGDYAYQIYYDNSKKSQVPELGKGGSLYTPNKNWLSVIDQYDASNYTVSPTYSTSDTSGSSASAGVNLQYERINTANGTDIYDAACYQIALALAEKYQVKSSVDLKKYINAPNTSFSINQFNGADGNDSACGANGGNRGITNSDKSLFYYGGCAKSGLNSGSAICGSGGAPEGKEIPKEKPQEAYYFRMITQQWTSADPFFPSACQTCYKNFEKCGDTDVCKNTLSDCYKNQTCRYSSYVQPVSKPPAEAYFPGVVTWADYKPITGENVWGLLLGPMTAVNILGESLTLADPRYLTAKGFLNGLQAMQSQCSGAFYYATQGSLGNTGSLPVNPFEVSTENNASALSGLLAFKKALSNMKPADPEKLIPIIDTMVWGPGGSASNPVGHSVLAYFKNYSWDKNAGFFKQGITESYPGTPPEKCNFQYSTGANAVDVNTWGIAALSPGLLDSWFGAGTAYQNWKKIKEWGGYYDPNTNALLGVGYSDADNNGPNKKGGIMSAEWSFGAINFVRSLINHYDSLYPDLLEDEKALVKGVMQLHSDYYANSSAFAVVNNDITTGRPAQYSFYVPTTTSSSPGAWFIYASKRYFIPFGWFANPLPSLTSTSWGVMTQYEYNPFNPNGDYSDWWKTP